MAEAVLGSVILAAGSSAGGVRAEMAGFGGRGRQLVLPWGILGMVGAGVGAGGRVRTVGSASGGDGLWLGMNVG